MVEGPQSNQLQAGLEFVAEQLLSVCGCFLFDSHAVMTPRTAQILARCAKPLVRGCAADEFIWQYGLDSDFFRKVRWMMLNQNSRSQN
jgi:hypothetical protein